MESAAVHARTAREHTESAVTSWIALLATCGRWTLRRNALSNGFDEATSDLKCAICAAEKLSGPRHAGDDALLDENAVMARRHNVARSGIAIICRLGRIIRLAD